MKILMVIHSLKSVGGAETIFVNYANYFVSQGDEVGVCILDNEEIYFELDPSITLYHKKSDKNGLRVQVKFIQQSIQQFIPDVVLSYVSAVNILSTIAAKRENTPIVMAEHSSYENGLHSKFWKILRRIVYPFANKLIILTQEDKEKYHYVQDVSVLRNPLRLQQNHLNIKREKIVFAAGRLEYIKGFDMLIEAFSQLDTTEWQLIIAGEGTQRTALETLVNNLNLQERVTLLGFVEGMEQWYRKASIFVLSSRTEGFPGALCEAMGYGCASIAFDCETGPKEIINHLENGILVPSNNIQKLSEEMVQLIKNEAQRAVLGHNAEFIKNQLDIDVLGAKWREILENIITASRQ